ncbi:ATP-binding protein [Hypericibacter sp.]|uniref:ATP-binding protein n=1 Tax=Hypericibacter sp. TaxID=2705401 RepID=UPI003D6D43F4
MSIVRRSAIWGGTFAVMAMLSMLQPTEPYPGLHVDVRAAMIALSVLFGGPLAGLLTAAVALVTRAAVGGPVMMAGLASITLSYLVATALIALLRREDGQPGPLRLLILGALVGSVGPLAAFLTESGPRALELMMAGGLHQVIAIAITMPLFAAIILETDRSRRSQESLRTHESELRATNAKLSELAAQLERRNGEYMAALDRAEAFGRAKSQFMANISHEFRTPLNAVIGFSDLLLMQAASEPEANKEYVQLIRASGERLLEIVNDVLTAVRIDGTGFEAELREFPLARVMREVIGFMEPVVSEKRQRIESDIDNGLLAYGDAKLLRQALIHVMGNASKFGPRDGLIEVRARQPDRGGIELAILDQGPGIEGEAIEAAFRPFWQRDGSDTREHGGLGLGLTIARHFVELQGGKIEISCRPGGGTCVRILLRRGTAALAA